MGRSKIKVELIQDHKKRMNTSVKRKASLVKKISELSILCDIKACMIIYDEGNSNCEMWPNEVKELINVYKDQPFEGRTKRGKTLSNYFKDEIKVEKDLDSRFDYFENDEKKKADAINVEKYPTWDSRFDYLSQKEIQNLVGVISKRMENAKGRIELLKSMNGSCSLSHRQQIWDYNNLMNQTSPWPISDHVNSFNNFFQSNIGVNSMMESENWLANDEIGSSLAMHPMGNNYGIIDSSTTMMQPMGNNEIGSSSTMQQPMFQYPFMYNGSTHVIGSSSTMQPPMGQYPFTNNDDSTGDIGSSSMQPIGNNNEIGPMDNDSTYDSCTFYY
nr:agamous-like MADS-box protein AGL80 [Solanum lycopersicum]